MNRKVEHIASEADGQPVDPSADSTPRPTGMIYRIVWKAYGFSMLATTLELICLFRVWESWQASTLFLLLLLIMTYAQGFGFGVMVVAGRLLAKAWPDREVRSVWIAFGVAYVAELMAWWPISEHGTFAEFLTAYHFSVNVLFLAPPVVATVGSILWVTKWRPEGGQRGDDGGQRHAPG